jgi:phytanoyl-CoA hydroxylase
MTHEMLAEGVLARDVGPIVAEYRERGFCHVPNVASPALLARLRERAHDIMHGRVAYPELFFQHDTTTGAYEDLEFGAGWRGPSDNYRKIEKLEVDPLFRAWLDNAFFERIVRAVVGEAVSIYRAILMTKAARGGTVLPWHQDAGKFWGLDRDPPIQIWTALDDAPEQAGCVEALEGSHLHGLATPLGGRVPEAMVREAGAEARAVAIPARAGDVIVLHNHVWHRSGVNRTEHTRRGFSVCYMSAATRCTRKKRSPRTFVRVFSGGDPSA